MLAGQRHTAFDCTKSAQQKLMLLKYMLTEKAQVAHKRAWMLLSQKMQFWKNGNFWSDKKLLLSKFFLQFRNLTHQVNLEKYDRKRKERNNQVKGQKEQRHSWHFFTKRKLKKWWTLKWQDNRRVEEHPQFLRGPTKNVSHNSGKNVAIKPHIYWPAIRPLKVKEGIYFWIQFPLSLKLEWGFWKTNWSTRRNFCVNPNLLFWN